MNELQMGDRETTTATIFQGGVLLADNVAVAGKPKENQLSLCDIVATT